MTLDEQLQRRLQNLEDPYIREKYYGYLQAQAELEGFNNLHPIEKQRLKMSKLAIPKKDISQDYEPGKSPIRRFVTIK